MRMCHHLEKGSHMSNNPTVSVVVPCYNAQEYVRESLESLVHQTNHDIEIVCVNDGSTDDTLEILEQYQSQDQRVTVVSRENGGYGKAVNIGIAHAKGEYIGILEPDDCMDLRAYERLYAYAKKYSLDVCKADFYKFWQDPRKNIKANYARICSSTVPYSHTTNTEQNADILLLNSPRGICTGIYRRSYLVDNEITLHESAGASYQDNGFYFKTMLLAKSIRYIPEAFYWYRQDNPNSSFKRSNNYDAMCNEHFYIESWLKETGSLWNQYREYYACIAFGNDLFTLHRLRDDLKLEYLLWLSKDLQRLNEEGLTFEKCDKSAFEAIFQIMSNPQRYYFDVVKPKATGSVSLNSNDRNNIDLEKKIDELSSEIKALKASNSWKIGRAITSFPRAIKRMSR